MTEATDPLDPRGVIREAYRIDGIESASCRSIFLDWALGLPAGVDATDAALALLARHEAAAPDHPMTAVLRESAEPVPRPRPRRGRR
jgi:hypothetical protein